MHVPFCNLLVLLLERDPTLIQDMFECEELIAFMWHPEQVKENPAASAKIRSSSDVPHMLQPFMQ